MRKTRLHMQVKEQSDTLVLGRETADDATAQAQAGANSHSESRSVHASNNNCRPASVWDDEDVGPQKTHIRYAAAAATTTTTATTATTVGREHQHLHQRTAGVDQNQ